MKRLLKNLMPKSLFVRGLLIVVLPMLLVQAVSAYIFLDRHWGNVTKHRVQDLGGELAFLAGLAEAAPSWQRYDIAAIFTLATSMEARYRPDAPLSHTPLPVAGVFADLQATLRMQGWQNAVVQNEGERFTVILPLEGGALMVSASAKRLESPTTTIFLLWTLGASFLALSIALIFLRNQVRPIKALAEAAERFGKGRETESFKPSGALEVRRAGRAFMVMRERIVRQVRNRTEMLAGISHDLRTPLTRMKLQLSMQPESEEREELLGDIKQMEHMIAEYLEFTRGGGGEEAVPVELIAELKNIAADYIRAGDAVYAELPEKEIALELKTQGFSRMMRNLIDNALRYGESCRLRIKAASNFVEIYVDDAGTGIAAENREEVFRPFARLDAARNLNEGGVGLGLSIARDMARSHGGDINLSRSPEGGLRVIVRLPV